MLIYDLYEHLLYYISYYVYVLHRCIESRSKR